MDAERLTYWVEPYPLLITKLYFPLLDTNLLTRPHLLELLDRAGNLSLVLITALAGWGQTTLAANWVKNYKKSFQMPVDFLTLY